MVGGASSSTQEIRGQAVVPRYTARPGNVPLSLMYYGLRDEEDIPCISVPSDAGHAALVAAMADLEDRDQCAFYIKTSDGAMIENPFLKMWKPGHGNIPLFVVADGAEGLPNGLRQVVPSLERLTCYPHFSRKLAEEYTSEMEEVDKGDMLEDIAMISSLDSIPEFDIGLQLFSDKWKEKADSGVRGVQKALDGLEWWCQLHNRGWSVAHGRGHALPNQNPVESTNRTIKYEISEWRLLTIINFLYRSVTWLWKESRRRMPGHPGGVPVTCCPPPPPYISSPSPSTNPPVNLKNKRRCLLQNQIFLTKIIVRRTNA